VSAPLRVLLADDHVLIVSAMRMMIERIEGVVVVAEAYNGRDAVVLARTHRPDLVIMDISMKDLNGIEAMRRIHESKPDLPVVILTAHADPGVEKEAREAGASGFLAKGTALEELVVVLHEAADGTE